MLWALSTKVAATRRDTGEIWWLRSISRFLAFFCLPIERVFLLGDVNVMEKLEMENEMTIAHASLWHNKSPCQRCDFCHTFYGYHPAERPRSAWTDHPNAAHRSPAGAPPLCYVRHFDGSLWDISRNSASTTISDRFLNNFIALFSQYHRVSNIKFRIWQ
jgi:hypothetical protein